MIQSSATPGFYEAGYKCLIYIIYGFQLTGFGENGGKPDDFFSNLAGFLIFATLK
jgi:hypothetical protein